MQVEICGDGRMTLAHRLRYLAFNFRRNFKSGQCGAKRLRFCAGRLAATPATASPGRALTESFLQQQLPVMLSPRCLRVLEIGCGSGSLTTLLAEAGFSGRYVGVDIADRFDRTAHPAFQRTFVLADAHSFEPEGKFDLVISVSALEHVAEDRRLLERLSRFVASDGIQLHFVPSGWGLPVYLWHGYRQYTLAAICERFDSRKAIVFAMGGAASFVLHLLFITAGEMLLRMQLRQRLPRLYGRLLDWCLQINRFAPVCATMYAVCYSAKVWNNSHD